MFTTKKADYGQQNGIRYETASHTAASKAKRYFAEPSAAHFRGKLPLRPQLYKERNDVMSKKESGIYFKCSQKQHEQIKKNAKECGLKQGEYILQRALGYEIGRAHV